MNIQVLTVHHHDLENEKEDRRITISPMNIAAIAAKIEEVEIRGRQLVHITVMLLDGENLDLFVNHADAELLEKATGSFAQPEF
jgi:hypothetical protein